MGRATEYVNTNTFSGWLVGWGLGFISLWAFFVGLVLVCFFFPFNEAFVDIAGGIGDIIKSSQTGKLENASSLFWETSFERRLLLTAINSSAFPG